VRSSKDGQCDDDQNSNQTLASKLQQARANRGNFKAAAVVPTG
jgi:hypothetical protein